MANFLRSRPNGPSKLTVESADVTAVLVLRGAIVVEGPLTLATIAAVKAQARSYGRAVEGWRITATHTGLDELSNEVEAMYGAPSPGERGRQPYTVLGCEILESLDRPGIWRMEWTWTP